MRRLKAADVEMCEFFAPPTETNFAGALLTGSQSACKAKDVMPLQRQYNQ